jgi:hypothetical protein
MLISRGGTMFKRGLCLALLALLVGVGEGLAQKPKEKNPRPTVRPRATVPMTAVATVPESESNDDYTIADEVNLGDEATGAIDPAGDWDWFVFSATAGQYIEIDVDAEEVGSSLDSYMYLYASDGVTELAENDDWGDWYDSHIRYGIPTTGNYYIALREFSDPDVGGPDYTYTVTFNALPPAVGDPVTEFASGFSCLEGMVTADDGTIYAADLCANEIKEVATDGTVSTFVSLEFSPRELVLDAFGNLIVNTVGAIYKVSPLGEVTQFDGRYVLEIAAAPDGSIWGCDPLTVTGEVTFHEYDPLGNYVNSITVSGSPQTLAMAFSPAGELHYTLGGPINKLVDGVPEVVVAEGAVFTTALAFDADGNMYAASYKNYEYYEVTLYGPDGTVLEDPFAREVESPGELVFGRDADGTPNGRLFVADYPSLALVSPGEGPRHVAAGDRAILEFNPDGVYADGAQVGVSMEMFTDTGLADELFGVGDLSEGEKDFLDFMGNQNGEYDVGDFRAYLMYIGVLPEIEQNVSRR